MSTCFHSVRQGTNLKFTRFCSSCVGNPATRYKYHCSHWRAEHRWQMFVADTRGSRSDESSDAWIASFFAFAGALTASRHAAWSRNRRSVVWSILRLKCWPYSPSSCRKTQTWTVASSNRVLPVQRLSWNHVLTHAGSHACYLLVL